MDGVTPTSWEHPAVAQIWFRWADYLVPCAALGSFTLGAAPHDPTARAALDEFADAVVAVLDGRALPPRDVAAAVPGLPNAQLLRSLSVTGKIRIRWDASRITMFAGGTAPTVDLLEARLDLARRFLSWLGPATPVQFAKWAGLSAADATSTWSSLAEELVPVGVEGRQRWVLTSDEEALMAPRAIIRGVRLLPMGDPYLHLDLGLIIARPSARLIPDGETSPTRRRALNALTGRLLVDGQLIGSWARTRTRLTLAPWAPIDQKLTQRIVDEVERLAAPLDGNVHIQWLD
jgi:hypothetical protein